MATTSTVIGKVSVTPKGTWSNVTAYDKLDVVSSGGSSYVAKQDVPAGTALTNTTYWQMIAQKGDTGDVSLDGTQTLTNKTIDAKDNTIKCSPTVIDKSYDEPVTLTLTKEENIATTGTDPFITLSFPPYKGFETRFTHAGSGHLYIKFTNPLASSVCIAITGGQSVKLVGCSDYRWSVEAGANFEGYDLQNIPTGETPNDYRKYLGAGIYSFGYDGSFPSYELPTGEGRNSVTVKWLDQYVAYAIDNVYSGKAIYQRLYLFGWQTGWTKFTGGGSGTVHTISTLQNGWTGSISWLVRNGVCYVTLNGVKNSSQSFVYVDVTNTDELPKCSTLGLVIDAGGGATSLTARFTMGGGSTILSATNQVANVDIYYSFSYPVADDWVES